MKTRCKFKCESVTAYQGNYKQIKFSAQYGSSPEDVSFAAATPSGTLEISVTNPDVVGKIKPGQVFYLDLIPVE